MTALDSIILGIVEGITEFLPVSSTGHLILASELLGLPSTEFLKSFEIAIQLGAILAVVALYWRSFLDVRIVKLVAAAFIPTAGIGLLLHDFAKEYLLGNVTVVLYALLVGGIALILFEYVHTEKEHGASDIRSISYKNAFVIGLFQSIAIIPGVSRSAATIVGGLVMGIRRIAVVEFSFLLAVPVMFAATGLDLYKSADAFSTADFGNLAIGFVVSFVVALLSIKFLLQYVRKHTFVSFGIYRILIACLFLLFLL